MLGALSYISYIVLFCLISMVPAKVNMGEVMLQSSRSSYRHRLSFFLFLSFACLLAINQKSEVNQITQDNLLNNIIV